MGGLRVTSRYNLVGFPESIGNQFVVEYHKDLFLRLSYF